MKLKELLDRTRLLKENIRPRKELKDSQKNYEKLRESFDECDESRILAEESVDWQRLYRSKLEQKLEDNNIDYEDIYVDSEDINGHEGRIKVELCKMSDFELEEMMDKAKAFDELKPTLRIN